MALLIIFTPSAYAFSLGHLKQMSPSQKKQAQEYFRAHSLGFSSIFKRYHPGPYWILKNKLALHLNASQIQKEEHLKNGMALHTIIDDRTLQHAYKIYSKNAAAMYPSLTAIKYDIQQVGKAETLLAWEMVPYHIQGYALLDSSQKSIYTQLAAKTWAKQHPVSQ